MVVKRERDATSSSSSLASSSAVVFYRGTDMDSSAAVFALSFTYPSFPSEMAPGEGRRSCSCSRGASRSPSFEKGMSDAWAPLPHSLLFVVNAVFSHCWPSSRGPGSDRFIHPWRRSSLLRAPSLSASLGVRVTACFRLLSGAHHLCSFSNPHSCFAVVWFLLRINKNYGVKSERASDRSCKKRLEWEKDGDRRRDRDRDSKR